MKNVSIAIAVLICLLAWGCEKKPEASPTPEPAKQAQTPREPEKQKLGKGLAGAEEVSVNDLLADPDKYKDKLVRVSGKIEDFCHHKRAWFGVTAKDGKGMVRVFTLPRFTVPSDCVGRQAVAEGKVEVIELDPDHAKHFSKDHKFLAGVKIEEGKPVKRPIVRAFGAEMW